MKHSLYYSSIIAITMLSASCATEKELQAPYADSRLVINLSGNDIWTYISLTDRKIVGTSAFGSENGDKKWQGRLDWDIAICDKHLRTNSETSGNGKGGILKFEGAAYEAIKSSIPNADFAVDTLLQTYSRK